MLLSVLALLFCVSCSSDNEKGEDEKGVVEQFSDKTAGKIVDYIKTPIDLAGDAVERVNEENEQNINKELEEEINRNSQ